MFKPLIAVLALTLTVLGGMSSAQDRPISGGLPWNNDTATPVLQQRLDDLFPDGTAVAALDAALANERFAMVSDDRGFSGPTTDGNRFASRGVVRFRFGCSTRVQLNWRQEDGQVFDMEGIMHEGCL